MKTQYFAAPLQTGVNGFYFHDLEEYNEHLALMKKYNVEEFDLELGSTNSDVIELMWKRAEVTQSNINHWFDLVELLDQEEKVAAPLYYLLDACGFGMEEAVKKWEEVEIVQDTAVNASQEIFDAKHSDLPEEVTRYIDYQAIARDNQLNGTMYEFDFVDGKTYTVINADIH